MTRLGDELQRRSLTALNAIQAVSHTIKSQPGVPRRRHVCIRIRERSVPDTTTIDVEDS